MSPINDWRALLADSHRALRDTVAGVPSGAWDSATPCDEWNATQVLQHAYGDQLGYASFITGGPLPTEDPFAPSGVLAAGLAELVDEATTASAQAFATVARRIVEPLRGFAYADTLDTGRETGPEAELLAYLGRRPDWSAG